MRSGRMGVASEWRVGSCSSRHSAISWRTRCGHPPACGPCRRRLDQASQRCLGVAEDRHRIGIVAAQLLRIDVELDDLGAGWRKHPVVGDLAAGAAADEEDQVGFRQRAVGAVARIGARHAGRQGMVVDDRRLGVERGCHRNRELLGELDELLLGARADHAAAGDDHRPLRLGERLDRAFARAPSAARDETPVRAGRRARPAGSSSASSSVICPRWLCTRRCTGPGAPEVATRNACRMRSGMRRHMVDLGVELGHRVELGDVVDLLVGVAMARLRRRAAGDRDDRGAGHETVAQPGRQIRGADHLRHADARLAAGAGVAVGHVGGGLLAVHHDAADRPVLHLGEGLEHESRHEEDVRDVVALHHLGETLRTGHPGHGDVVLSRFRSVERRARTLGCRRGVCSVPRTLVRGRTRYKVANEIEVGCRPQSGVQAANGAAVELRRRRHAAGGRGETPRRPRS